MTDSSSVRQESDVIDARRVTLMLLGGLLVAALATAGSRLLRGNPSTPPPHATTGAAFAPRTPERALFDGHERGVTLRAAQTERLNHYSRADRAGMAHIPITRAIELELGAQR